MNESKFLQLSEKILLNIADIIEDNDKDSIFEVDYLDGILNIEIFKTSQTYVINRHIASMKIWFSSPISGAKYFSYNDKNWINDDNIKLQDFLFKELSDNFKLVVTAKMDV